MAEVEKKQFSYHALCREQEIGVVLPDDIIVSKSEAFEIADLILRMTDLFQELDRIKKIVIDELRICQQYNCPPRFDTSARLSKQLVRTMQLLTGIDGQTGLKRIINSLTLRTNLTSGMKGLIIKFRIPLDIIETQLRMTIDHIFQKKSQYDKLGSDCGHTGNVGKDEVLGILEKCVQMENYAYDFFYVGTNVLITHVMMANPGLVPEKLFAEAKNMLIKFAKSETQVQQTVEFMMASLDPSSRFVVDNSEDIIFNL